MTKKQLNQPTDTLDVFLHKKALELLVKYGGTEALKEYAEFVMETSRNVRSHRNSLT